MQGACNPFCGEQQLRAYEDADGRAADEDGFGSRGKLRAAEVTGAMGRRKGGLFIAASSPKRASGGLACGG